MNIWTKWTQISLVKRILVGLIIGAILGMAIPSATAISILGSLFVGALKALAPLLVFFIVMNSLAHHKKGGKTNMSTVIVLYLVGTFLAALCAVVASFAFPSTLILAAGVEQAAPGGIGEVLKTLLMNAVSNPISSIVNANYIGVLTWAVIFGLALRESAETTKTVLENVSDALSSSIKLVINCAPFGILGLVFDTVASTGLSAFASYMHVILVLVCCMFFVALGVNPIIVFICTRENPYPLVFKCLRDSGIMAFFTRSSAANIPVNMSLCEDLGLDKEKYSVSIPLGATINMDGNCICLTIISLFFARICDVAFGSNEIVLLLLLVLILSLGAPIAPGSLILCLVTLLTQMGIDISVISLVIGISFILEMLLGMVNSVGNVVVALLVARKEGSLDLDTYRRI